MPEYTHTLVATLGGQPQVVTFTLDLLLRRGIAISEVIVIHPYASAPRLQHSLDLLNAEFIGDRYQIDGHILTCHFRPKILELDHAPLADISDNASAKGTRETVYRFIQEMKQQPRHIHLSVTGGRRLMALLAISAAQLLFDPFDHIWHIYTPEHIKEKVKDGTCMHVPPDTDVNLIEVPFFPLGDYSLNISPMINTAQAAQYAQKQQMDAREHDCCKQVERALNKRPLSVLRAFARGMSPQEVAEDLSITLSTVSTHTSRIFEECRIAWDLPTDHSLNYYFLRDKFGKYFDHNE